MSLFSWFVMFTLVFLTLGAVRRLFLPAAAPEAEPRLYLEQGDAEALPEAFVQPLGDACVDITRASMDALSELEVAEKALAAADGSSQQAAPIHLERAFVMMREAADHAAELTEELHDVPEEVGWWLGHVVEQCEAVCTLEETAQALLDVPANAVHRAAVGQGIEATENLLLGAHDFSERMLGFDLRGWVQEEIGRDAAKRFQRGIDAAVKRVH